MSPPAPDQVAPFTSSADIGGLRHPAIGALHHQAEPPQYHHAWEPRVMAMALATGALGQWTIDHSRHQRESIPQSDYLAWPYYRIWFEALCALLQQRQLVTEGECRAAAPQALHPLSARALPVGRVDAALQAGSPTERVPTAPARFGVGDRVRVRVMAAGGHTRAPRYVQGRVGTIEALHGAHLFPDRRVALGPLPPFDEQPEWLYTVVFDGQTLWGDAGEPHLQVSVDAFEPYLERVDVALASQQKAQP